MKKYLLLTFVAFLGFTAVAQEAASKKEEAPECANKWGTDSVETAKQLSLFNQYYQEKKYLEALPYWDYLFENTPCIQKRITYAGPFIIKKKLREIRTARKPITAELEAKRKELKEAGNQANYDAHKAVIKESKDAYNAELKVWTDKVFKCYEKRIEFFGQEGYIKGKWADDIAKLTPTNRAAALIMFDESITLEGDKSTSDVPKDYMYAGVKEYKKKKITQDELFIILDKVTPVVEANTAKYRAPGSDDVKIGMSTSVIKKFFGKPDTSMTTSIEGTDLKEQVFNFGSLYFKEGKVYALKLAEGGELIKETSEETTTSEKDLITGAKWKQTQDGIISFMKPYLSCDKITELKEPTYNANITNVVWLKATVKLLDRGGCESAPFYLKCSEALFSLEPSSDAALSLAKAFNRQGDKTKAANYYNKAADLATDDDSKYAIYIKLAKTAKNSKEYSTVRDYARKALAINENSGEAYILIGDAYRASASSCGGGDLGRAGVYLVAADKYAKAKRVDPSVADKANTKIGEIRGSFPDKESAFFKGITAGSSYFVGCWIQESTTVRFNGG